MPMSTPHAPPRKPTPSAQRGRRSSHDRRPLEHLHQWLSAADREVLWLYLLTRVGIWTTAGAVGWLFPPNRTDRIPRSFLTVWQQWDWWHFLHIAQGGYFPNHTGPWTPGWDNREAFFPGFPLTLRAVHTLIPHWAASGALISLVSGAVAALTLARIARHHLTDPDSGRRTALFFLLSPCAVFLAAGYTEALFLALALPAWHAAQHHKWPAAAVLTTLSCSVRVTGLFLASALLLHFFLTGREHRSWRAAPWLALPALPPALYFWYLHVHTGDWMAWKHAQERGWYRDFHTPWEAWANTWTAAFGHTQPTGNALMWQAELLAMLAGIALLVLLVRRRHFPEALYLGLTLYALGTSYWYTSIPRSTLLWWPLWIVLAGWSLRRPRVQALYFYAAGPLTTIVAITFLTGRWAG
ncbi:mannosyltransferase family protein [Streptomyces sp. NPDC002886]|uniref:mannosyltransferase family protein n=1 Tax=Streptomyces sp. NPDC002886 TaxID=3364667 RepID=UPI0036ACD791